MTIKMKILLLDNYDSFTYNLLHVVKELGATDIEVVRNDQIELDEVDRFDKSSCLPDRAYPKKPACYYLLLRDMLRPKAFWGSAWVIRLSAKPSEHVWKTSKKYIMAYKLR